MEHKYQNRSPVDPKQKRLDELLTSILRNVGPDKKAKLLEILNTLRDSVLDAAVKIAEEHPAQFERFLVALDAFANNMYWVAGDTTEVREPEEKSARRITSLRHAVQFGFGKIMNRWRHRQEHPED